MKASSAPDCRPCGSTRSPTPLRTASPSCASAWHRNTRGSHIPRGGGRSGCAPSALSSCACGVCPNKRRSTVIKFHCACGSGIWDVRRSTYTLPYRTSTHAPPLVAAARPRAFSPAAPFPFPTPAPHQIRRPAAHLAGAARTPRAPPHLRRAARWATSPTAVLRGASSTRAVIRRFWPR